MERLDVLLLSRGLVSGRDRAKEMIRAGAVTVNGTVAVKAGQKTDENADIQVIGQPLPYVSRGGLKLEAALEKFSLSLNGKVCLDVGASSGGFTDCMLQRGARRVYAVDVGKGQLHPSLCNDARVVNMEQTNFRYLEQLPEQVSFFSCDVSFISLSYIFPVASALLAEGGEGICLVKPQFEAGRSHVGKKGVVKDPGVHIAVLEQVSQQAGAAGLSPCGVWYSPVKGPEGNIEYLLYVKKNAASLELPFRQIVDMAHQQL